ncbi:MAG: hypothetical protein JWQ74_1193 [Marmoricola sp.]|nr:hypothetical protein [Marmoricola sp.]
MTPAPTPAPTSGDDGQHEPTGRIQVTGPGPLVVLGLAGLFIGWAARGVAIRSESTTPTISWLAVALTWFLVAVTAGTAYLTWRAVRRERLVLSPQQGLARLVLGKTMARLAASALGGYVGVAISNIGVEGDKADRVILHALLAGLGAATGVAAGLLLEHACRVPPEDPGVLP